METIIGALLFISDKINLLLTVYIEQYIVVAIVVVILTVIIALFSRNGFLLIIPAISILMFLALILMSIAGTANLEWDDLLIWAIIHLGVGYLLYIIVSNLMNQRSL